jgi:hypothetical protein
MPCVARLAPLHRGASGGMGAGERRGGKRHTVLAASSVRQQCSKASKSHKLMIATATSW